ncbi:MAG: hypothetical protein Q8R33_15425 [Burkholderiales bacterium]|nr:hypothetical protein [Burkholderiales bacterium]
MNVGVFVVAALLLDLVLWLLILLGWESVTIPSNFASTHQPDFVFPYSHSLVAGVLWAALAGALAYFSCSLGPSAKRRVVVLVAAAVFSHWLLDALVHQPEMSLLGAGSPKLGLALWNNMLVALFAEAAVVVVGLYLFVSASGWPRTRSMALIVLSLGLLALTVVGMTIAPAPPSALAMAGSSLGSTAAVCALFGWLGRRARGGQV